MFYIKVIAELSLTKAEMSIKLNSNCIFLDLNTLSSTFQVAMRWRIEKEVVEGKGKNIVNILSNCTI